MFDLSVGKVVGRQYRILSFLGRGWEGEVYCVEEISTGITRAMKLFYRKRYFSGAPHVEYAKKLYRLRHCPVIIQYHHQGTLQIKGHEIHFVVSEFVEGDVLSRYVAGYPQKRLVPFEALHLFYALLLGVEKIHFSGEYHGDIHEDNVMLTRKGIGYEVHLIDLLHLGKATKARVQEDVYDLINLFYDMLGGAKTYHRMPPYIKSIILGRRKQLIAKKFQQAGHLRLYIDNLDWDL